MKNIMYIILCSLNLYSDAQAEVEETVEAEMVEAAMEGMVEEEEGVVVMAEMEVEVEETEEEAVVEEMGEAAMAVVCFHYFLRFQPY